MTRTVLPNTLIEEITKFHNQGLSSIEIFDSIQEEAQKYVTSGAQLARCISAIKRKATPKAIAHLVTPEKVRSIPLPKPFDASKYQDLISSLKEETDLKRIETRSQPIVFDILNKEGFQEVKDVNQESGFSNPPFDFFGFKNGEPYMIEFKGSLEYFHSPKETQKRRLQELTKEIERLHVALIQLRVNYGDYRIFLDREMDLFFDGPQAPLEPVITWIKTQIKNG
jgi:hypothetical protein